MPVNKPRIVNVDKPVFKMADPNDPVKYRLNPQPATGPATFDKLKQMMGGAASKQDAEALMDEGPDVSQDMKALMDLKQAAKEQSGSATAVGDLMPKPEETKSDQYNKYMELMKKFDEMNQKFEMEDLNNKPDENQINNLQGAVDRQQKMKEFREDFHKRNGRLPTWEEQYQQFGSDY